MNYKEHPKIKDLLPPLAKDDYERLRNSIKKEGVKIPILVNENGEIVDGYNRYKIAKEFNIEAPIKEEKFEDEVMAGVAYNTARRQFTPEQKKELIKKLRKEGYTQQQTAEMVGISRQRVDQVEDINKANICNAYIPDNRLKLNKESRKDIFKRVNAGETQTQVASDYGITQPRITQLLKKEKTKDEKVKQVVSESKTTPKIIYGDCRNYFEKIQNESFDLLLTDPPYCTDVDDDYGHFIRTWLFGIISKIKKTGRIFVFCSSYPQELFAYLNEFLQHPDIDMDRLDDDFYQERHNCFDEINMDEWMYYSNNFEYGNLLIWHYKNHLGPTPNKRYKMSWNGIFYLHGKDAQDLNITQIKDFFDHFEYSLPDERHERKYHPWEKPLPLIERLIKDSTNKGGRVLDCFAGAGTVGLASSRLGRESLSFEIDDKYKKAHKERGFKEVGINDV